jgi:hypothetical protein
LTSGSIYVPLLEKHSPHGDAVLPGDSGNDTFEAQDSTYDAIYGGPGSGDRLIHWDAGLDTWPDNDIELFGPP